MIKTVRLGGQEYDVSTLGEEGRSNLAGYQYATEQLKEAENLYAVLTKARRAYISDIKNEMIQGKSGVDLAALFGD